jgi:DNA-binding response OmpR family regulator
MNTGDKKKILIIDDDVDFSESIATFLDLHGFTVFQARAADQGIALAAAVRPDLILCDVMMKERTEGFFAVQQLRRTPGVEQTPIFMVSSVYAAVPSFRIEPEQSWLAHDEFITKPFDPIDLLARIETTMSGKETL